MKKGFTLIELLAVIIILGILTALIAPKVVNMIEEAEKNTNMTSAQNLAKAAQLKAQNNDAAGTNENIIINYETGENANYLDYNGSKPEKGKINIRTNGTIAMSVKFGDYCYQKNYDSSNIDVIPYSEDTCAENADFIINHETPELTTSGDGLYEAQGEPGRYIYRGANPNNYIYLKEDGTNNTVYRIISYETDGTIKVVRDEKLFDKEWDEGTARRNTASGYYCTSFAGCNVWGNQGNTYYHGTTLANLNQEFVYKYYPSNTSTSLENYTNTGSTGSVSQDSTLNTYLNNTWINIISFKDKIINHSFNVGGVYLTNSYNEKSLEKIKDEEQVYIWNGKIALMTISEYQEASLSDTCSFWSNFYANPSNYHIDQTGKIVSRSDSEQWPCEINNWTYKSEYSQWSLSPVSSYCYVVWSVYGGGPFNYNSAFDTIGVRPAFYLKPSVKLGGTGTSIDPYYIIES